MWSSQSGWCRDHLAQTAPEDFHSSVISCYSLSRRNTPITDTFTARTTWQKLFQCKPQNKNSDGMFYTSATLCISLCDDFDKVIICSFKMIYRLNFTDFSFFNKNDLLLKQILFYRRFQNLLWCNRTEAIIILLSLYKQLWTGFVCWADREWSTLPNYFIIKTKQKCWCHVKGERERPDETAGWRKQTTN